MRKLTWLVATLCLVSWCPLARAAALLAPGDFIIAIDTDPPMQLVSSSPGAEQATNVLDGLPTSKYLNRARWNSGFIVTPAIGATTLHSMVFTTANDSLVRDPASWALYGTNDPITSAPHGLGNAESWTLIGQDNVAMPDDRFTNGPLISFSNSTAYASYRLTFPTLKAPLYADSMQIADVYMYEDAGGAGASVLGTSDFIIPINTNPPIVPNSRSQTPNEEVYSAIDGDFSKKYTNFGRENSGFIVTPSGGSSAVTSFQIWTPGDRAQRDPASWILYGTNDPIASTNNSQGDAENWTLIDQGSTDLPTDRNAAGPITTVNNSTAYASYRMIFPTVRAPNDSTSTQFAEIQFFGDFALHPGDFDGDGDVDGADFVAWQTNFPKASGATLANGDADGDGDVDGADFVVWQTNFPYPPGGVAPVPEPQAFILAACGLSALLCYRRWRTSFLGSVVPASELRDLTEER
jgi:hypothetical protein